MITKYNNFINENSNTDDLELTNFRQSIEGYGEPKEKYSYSNNEDVDKTYDIIESIIFNNLVAQKMLSYNNEVDAELDNNIEQDFKFLDSVNAEFSKGELNIGDTPKDVFIKEYIKHSMK